MTSVASAMSALATLQTLGLQSSASPPSAPTAPPASAPAGAIVTQSSPGAAAGLFGLGEGAAQALSAADAAGAAGQTVLGLLQQMRDAAGQASDPAVTDAERSGLQTAFQTAAGGIGSALASATVNGTNLVDGSMGQGLKVPLGGGTTASLSPADLTLGGATLGLAPGATVETATAASATYMALGGAIGAASGALATLQGQAGQVDAHLGFVQQLGQALASPGDDGDDSVRLLALQVSQQLSSGTTGIANAQPQSVLSLFRS